jgi:hypothetical protein
VTPVSETKRNGRFIWPLRVSVSLTAVLLFNQAVFAGQFLSGTFASLRTHRENATAAGIIVLVTAISAALLRWPGRGPLWPLLACLGLLGLIALQMALGLARVLTLHIPLGVLVITAGLHLAVWSWRYRPEKPTPASPPGTPAAVAAGDTTAVEVPS